ncbi:MAG: hemolysin D [Gemmatimonadetes bacterium 13_1_40CM_4_69_8]|nr:MAG: hemolysin D [Gemmatimonadetes bacterium 13_1_40CM_4_69_8]PYP73947.1 MAG: hemolysin D [Gemmatimonadota bacterium]
MSTATPPPTARPQSPGEEIANTISHAVGLVATLVGVPFLIGHALRRGSTAGVVGASVFACTIVLLYLASTLYHALPRTRAKRLFRMFDHEAIFLFIAGTYTPFTLGVLRGVWGWSLFGIVWGLALLGIVLNATGAMRYRRFSTGVYLGMGWLMLIAIRPLWLRLPLPGVLWLLAGGLAYTVGVAFFSAKRIPYSHLIWHLFVLVGTSCHFIAVLLYAA